MGLISMPGKDGIKDVGLFLAKISSGKVKGFETT
jgi:hypothetical protein